MMNHCQLSIFETLIVNRDTTRRVHDDVTYVCVYALFFSARCAHARCIFRHKSKRDTMMNLWDDWQKKREKSENRGRREVTRRARICLRDVQPLSMDYRDQIALSFVENRIMQAAE